MKNIKLLKSEGFVGFTMLLPSIVLQLLFSFVPLVTVVVLSLTGWNLMPNTIPNFIGLNNYVNLFKDDYFWKCLHITLLFSIIAVPLSVAYALFVSVLLIQRIKAANLYRLIYFLPGITTLTAVSTVWGYILAPDKGMLNNFLRSIGVSNPPSWLASPDWVIPALLIIALWLWVGYDSVIYIAGLKSIPDVYYEAAKMDGANWLQQFLKITVPLISPTTFFLMVTGFISAFQIFDLIYVFTGGGPAGSSMVVNMYIYQIAFKYLRIGYGSAASCVLFLLILVITVFQMKVQQKWVNYAK